MGVRRKGRELALQILYQMDAQGDYRPEQIDNFTTNFQAVPRPLDFARGLVRGMCERLGEIDGYITRASEHFKLERMPVVDRSLMRLAVYELLCRDDISPGIVLNEAVEIAKKYGSEETPAFVNGVLDRVMRMVNEERDGGGSDAEK